MLDKRVIRGNKRLENTSESASHAQPLSRTKRGSAEMATRPGGVMSWVPFGRVKNKPLITANYTLMKNESTITHPPLFL
jgi:hypothetical protein